MEPHYMNHVPSLCSPCISWCFVICLHYQCYNIMQSSPTKGWRLAHSNIRFIACAFWLFLFYKHTISLILVSLPPPRRLRIRIHWLARTNLLWDILRLPSSRRAALGLYFILTLWRAWGVNQPPYALLHRSSPRYALRHGRRHYTFTHVRLAVCLSMCLLVPANRITQKVTNG